MPLCYVISLAFAMGWPLEITAIKASILCIPWSAVALLVYCPPTWESLRSLRRYRHVQHGSRSGGRLWARYSRGALGPSAALHLPLTMMRSCSPPRRALYCSRRCGAAESCLLHDRITPCHEAQRLTDYFKYDVLVA